MTIPRCSLIRRPSTRAAFAPPPTAAHFRAPTGGGAANITDSKDRRLCKPYKIGRKTQDTSTQ